jgi:CrcB protein
MIKNILLISLGAVLGALLRYSFMIFPLKLSLTGNLFRVAVINIIGSALMGALSTLELKHSHLLFYSIGFLGSFTTFSSFTLGFFDLVDQSPFWAFLYFSITVIGSFLCFLVVRGLVKHLF